MNERKKFGLIGAAGYIAPRHLQAIKASGHELVVAFDINDSVGILDKFFPNAEFFTEFECFQSYIEDEKLKLNSLDFLSICSPNNLHAPHIKFGLRNGIDVICEKPLVLTNAELDSIKKYETTYSANVYSILQLRLHPSLLELKELVKRSTSDQIFDVELTYITSRGRWYNNSWKGVEKRSGGLVANIGIHFFDVLGDIFGKLEYHEVYLKDQKTYAGYLEYKKARVNWLLSIDASLLPPNAVEGEKRTFRSIKVAGKEVEFSDGFEDLHNESYKRIFENEGFGIEDNRAAISTLELIRGAAVTPFRSPQNSIFDKLTKC